MSLEPNCKLFARADENDMVQSAFALSLHFPRQKEKYTNIPHTHTQLYTLSTCNGAISETGHLAPRRTPRTRKLVEQPLRPGSEQQASFYIYMTKPG